MRRPRGEEILVVTCVPQQEHTDGIDEFAVAADVEIEIAAHAAAGENAHRPVDALLRTGGVFHGLPRAFQKLPVLRVHDRGFLRAEAEELCVEHLHVRELGGCAHVVGVAQSLGRLTGGDQLLVRQKPYRLHTAAQVPPELFDAAGAGQPRRHPDDRDVVFRVRAPGVVSHRLGCAQTTRKKGTHQPPEELSSALRLSSVSRLNLPKKFHDSTKLWSGDVRTVELARVMKEAGLKVE